MKWTSRCLKISAIILLHGVCVAGSLQAANVTITVVDSDAVTLLPSQIYLKDAAGKAIMATGLPFFRDHFVCSGRVDLELPQGRYTYEAERGPEYSSVSGTFNITNSAEQKLTIQLQRIADLAAEGWWSGELHVHRPLEHVPLLMQAADLHVAPVITWWNNQNRWKTNAIPEKLLLQFDGSRFYHVMGGEDEREGGALLYFNLKKPILISGAKREYPSPMAFLHEAKKEKNVWVDIEKPFWWDVPVWLALGEVDSIGLANNHMCRDQMFESEAWGKPRDEQRLPPPRGNGFWTQELYYQILNSGLRLSPSAGSASGVLPNPVGYNRVYVYLGKSCTYSDWWRGLRAGRSFVSNGPLLRCRANGELPGHVFKGRAGKALKIELEGTIGGRDSLASIEIIKNGRVERSVTFEEWKRTGKLGSIRFEESGWFLIRTITDNPKTFRFASTAPFYVEIGKAKQRISRTAVQFFLDWIGERKSRIKIDDATEGAEVLKHHEAAEKFWRDRLSRANAD
jgi:hypothetical protein